MMSGQMGPGRRVDERRQQERRQAEQPARLEIEHRKSQRRSGERRGPDRRTSERRSRERRNIRVEPAPRHKEHFAEALNDLKKMQTLRLFLLMGSAYRRGASSLRGVREKLKPLKQQLGWDWVPLSTKDYHDCVEDITEWTRAIFPSPEGSKLEPFLRLPTPKPVGQDNRRIIGLSKFGWRIWEEAKAFLSRHGGPETMLFS